VWHERGDVREIAYGDPHLRYERHTPASATLLCACLSFRLANLNFKLANGIQVEFEKYYSKTYFLNSLMQKFVFRVVIHTFQNNTLTLNKNNDCELHKKAFGASNIGAANAFSCFGFCFWTD
jgi:hypothetical protein